MWLPFLPLQVPHKPGAYWPTAVQGKACSQSLAASALTSSGHVLPRAPLLWRCRVQQVRASEGSFEAWELVA